MDNTFLPLIFRMRYINRWSLMFNTEQEDLMQHTAECAFLVHFLATIGNRCFEKQYDADKLAVCALFHDAPEVLTGDLPTPVKYYNDEMKTIYKQIEKSAAEKPPAAGTPRGLCRLSACLGADARRKEAAQMRGQALRLHQMYL